MPVDRKYGRVRLEHGTVGVDEPVVVFRAQDGMLPALLQSYAGLCRDAGSPQRHVDGIEKSLADVVRWQREHAGQVQVPQSARGED